MGTPYLSAPYRKPSSYRVVLPSIISAGSLADESFPNKPPANIFLEACEAKPEMADNTNGFRDGDSPAATATAAARHEDESRSVLEGRDCSPPLGDSARARTAEEMPAVQRARHLELQRLAIEKKELEAQLAEVKSLMRARKARPNAALIGLLDRAAGAAPKRQGGERLTRRRRKRRRRRPRRPSTARSSEDAGVARSALTETRQSATRGQIANEFFDASAERPFAADGRRVNSSPARAAGAPRRRRKRSGERGHETRRWSHETHVARKGSPDTSLERRRTPEPAVKKTVAFNTTVPAERPADTNGRRAHSSPQGRRFYSGGEGSPRRRLRRPKSASRRSRSTPSPSILGTTGIPSVSKKGDTKREPLAQRAMRDPQQGGRCRGRGGKTGSLADDYNPREGRTDDTRDDEKRRVYFSTFPIRGNRSSAAVKDRAERQGRGQSASMSPPLITNGTERLVERATSHTITPTPYSDDDSCAYEDAAFHESANYDEDDFEIVSARGSYESDFEPWENSRSDFELREQSESVESHLTAPKGTRVLVLKRGDRSPRIEAGVDSERQEEGRNGQPLSDSDKSLGDERFEPSGDCLLRSGENWGDGRHRPAKTPRVISGGAASWEEWNQPDDDPSGFALVDGRDTSLSAAAAAAKHDGSLEGSTESASGFDYLWVADGDDTLARNAEDEPDATGRFCSPTDAYETQRNGTHAYCSGEYHSARTFGGQPPPSRSRGIDDGDGNAKPEFYEKNREEERVSTASLSDGGASLYNILVSSHDESGSGGTWSLESYDRRDDAVTIFISTADAGAGTSAEVRPVPVPGSVPPLQENVRPGNLTNAGKAYPAARVSSDGSSLYDVTSRASDADEKPTLGGSDALPPLGKTAQQKPVNQDPADAAGLAGSAQEVIPRGPLRDARTSPAGVRVEPMAAELTRSDRAQETITETKVPPSDQISVGAGPTSFDEVGGKRPAYKGPPPQRSSAGDAGAVGRPRDTDAIVGGRELEYNGSYDEYSLEWGSDSPTDGRAEHGYGGDAEKHLAEKQPFDELFAGDRLSQVLCGSADEDHKRHDRHDRPNDEVKPARDQGAATGQGHRRGSELEPEGSADLLYAFGEQGITPKDYGSGEGARSSVDAGGLSARGEEPSVDEDRSRGTARLEEGQSRIVDGSLLEAGGSLDEISSLDKQGWSLTEQSTSEIFAQEERPFVVESRNLGTSSTGVGGGGTVRSSQLAPEESLDNLSSVAEQGLTYEEYRPGQRRREPDSAIRLLERESGPSRDGNHSRGATRIEEDQGRVVDGSQLEAEGSLDELSSLEELGGARKEQSTGEELAQAEKSSAVENRVRGTKSSDAGGAGNINSIQLVPEESVDELSSLDKHGEPYKDGNLGTSTPSRAAEGSSVDAGGVFAKAQGLSIDQDRTHGAPSVEGGQARAHEAEDSLDELSSLERQEEPRTEQFTRKVFGEADNSSVIRNGSRGTSSTGVRAGGAVDIRQFAPEESIDELSSLDKQGEPYQDNDNLDTGRLPSEGGRSSADAGGIREGAGGIYAGEDPKGGVPGVKEGQSRVVDGSQIGAEESLDELSSLERHGESPAEQATAEAIAQAEEPSTAENGKRTTSSTGVSAGAVGDSSQLAPEESLDELSSLDKQGEPNKDDNLGASGLFSGGGRSSVDAGGMLAGAEGLYGGEDLYNGAPSVEEGLIRVVDGIQLDAEGSLDELSSLEKHGEPHAEHSAGEVFPQAGEPSAVENGNRSTSTTWVGEGGAVDSSHLAPEESLDELASLSEEGVPYNPRTGQRSPVGALGVITKAQKSPVGGTFAHGASGVEEGQSRIVDGSQLDVEGSLDELSSLEKQGESSYSQSTGEVFPQAEEPSVVRNGDRSASGTGGGEGGDVLNGRLAPEESFDELSSLGKQGDPYTGDNLGELSGEKGRPSVDDALGMIAVADVLPVGTTFGRVASITGEGRTRIVDGSHEESLDELSSLEKHEEPRAERSNGEAFAQSEGPSVAESSNRITRGTGLDEGGVVRGSRLAPEESVDELSSLGKHGELYDEQNPNQLFRVEERESSVDAGRLSTGGGLSSVDEEHDRHDRGAFKSTKGQNRVVDSGQFDVGESLDELSSLDRQEESRTEQSTDVVLAQAGESSVDESANRGAPTAEAGGGGTVNSSQLAPEESVDELSSLDKQGGQNKDNQLGRLSVEGEWSSVDADGLPARGGQSSAEESRSLGVPSAEEDQSRSVDGVPLEAEETVDELSSIEKQGESRTEQSTGELVTQAEEPSVVKNDTQSMSSTGEGRGGAVDRSQLAPEESLDELSSLEAVGETRRLSAGVVSAQEPKVLADEKGNGSTRGTKVREEGAAHSSQLAPEESYDDGLSAQEKEGEPREEQPCEGRSAAGGESSIDEYRGSADNLEAAQGRIKELEAEQSVDELSAVDRKREDPRLSGLVAAEKLLLRDRQTEEIDQPLDDGSGKRWLGASESRGVIATVHGHPNTQQEREPDPDGSRSLNENFSPYLGDPSLLASILPPGDEDDLQMPFGAGEESLDEYLFDGGGGSSFGDLQSLDESLFDGGRSRGLDAAVEGEGSSSIEKHSLDRSLGGLSSTDDDNSLLYDVASLPRPATSGSQLSSFDGSLSDDVLV